MRKRVAKDECNERTDGVVNRTGAKQGPLSIGAVIPAPCHEHFYGKYRTLLKQARNHPPKGRKRKPAEVQQPKTPTPKCPARQSPTQTTALTKQPPTKRIEALEELAALNGRALEAQMRAWGVPVKKSDKVGKRRDKLLKRVRNLQELKED